MTPDSYDANSTPYRGVERGALKIHNAKVTPNGFIWNTHITANQWSVSSCLSNQATAAALDSHCLIRAPEISCCARSKNSNTPYWAGLVYNLCLDPSCNPSRRGPSHMQCSATRPQPFPLSLGAAPPYGAARLSTDPQSPLSVGLECIKPHCLPHRRRLDSGNAAMHLFMLF
ncbi:hypothetical protein K456DRAFT_927220 [Colletotrichum gloeosporioides 23]|nr:hypothetical protein K456DRAFT_927220 [Colletotrichum gloeosporioides 23]